MSQPTRISLIERLRQTDPEDAWEEFADIYDHLILTWLRKEAVQAADAEDIRQEVMTTVLGEIRGFEHSGKTGAFRRWLRRITANRMRRTWDKKSSTAKRAYQVDLASIADQLEDDNSRLSLEWDRQHDAILLRKMFDSLAKRFSPENIRAVQRVLINQEPAAEVAEDVGMTLGSLRVAQHRILQALKELAGDLAR